MTRRVLSMWQPWASFLFHPRNALPVKRWETRAFHPQRYVKGIPLPIECAVHATLNRSGLRDLLCFPEYREAMQRSGLVHKEFFPLGMIIGVATIVEVVPTDTINSNVQAQRGATPDALDLKLGNYSPGRYAWRIAFATLLPKPIPFKGRQSVLWLAPPELDAAIDKQLGERAIA